MQLTNSQIKSLYPVLAQEELSSRNSDVKINWALQLIEQGVETSNLLILASLPTPANEFETDDYFNRTLVDLGVKRPSVSSVIESYVKYLVEQILSEDLLPEVGISRLYSLYSYSSLATFETPAILLDVVGLDDKYYCEAVQGWPAQERRDEIIRLCKEANKTLCYARLDLDS